MSKKTVLIIGSSFGGLTAASTLSSKFNVTVIDQKQFFEFTPSFHYALTDITQFPLQTADISTYATKHNFSFICGKVNQLNETAVTITNPNSASLELRFDYCIIATGSSYASNIKSPISTIQQRIDQLQSLIQLLRSSSNVLVIGGQSSQLINKLFKQSSKCEITRGAVGVEIASQLPTVNSNMTVHLWSKSPSLLSTSPPRSRRLAFESLTKLGVRVQLNKPIDSLPDSSEFDYIFDCRGNINAPEFMMNEAMKSHVDSRGRIVVSQYLNLEESPNIFCIGDACITPVNEAKMSYNASIQGQYAAENIIEVERKAMTTRKLNLNKVNAGPGIFAITTGKRKAILCLGSRIAFESCLVHYMKMLVEWITVGNFKGKKGMHILSYIQRQLLIFFACLVNCCCCCSSSSNSSSSSTSSSSNMPQNQKAQVLLLNESNKDNQLSQQMLKAD